LAKGIVRILAVDDSEPWRRFLRLALLIDTSIQIIAEASDGPEAVIKARELHPDIILLDLGLPTLNGLEAARQIRENHSEARIIVVSENRSPEIAEEAFRIGACGYVVKSDAGSELLRAVEAAVRGDKYVSTTLMGHGLTGTAAEHPRPSHEHQGWLRSSKSGNVRMRHEVGFYSDDRDLLESAAQFIGTALAVGNAAIVIATESHRDSLHRRLHKYGIQIDAAVESGKYIALDADGTLSTIMMDGEIDEARFAAAFDELIHKAAEAASAGQSRVAIFGECVHLLRVRGNSEAAIQIEKLGNQLAKKYEVDILCAYCLKSFQGGTGSRIFERICAEHSAVHNW
jgi:DNA-binding NarL/FixJ family response regulator